MYVCLCNAVTDTEIYEAIDSGYDDIQSIGLRLGVGMCCGSCLYQVQAMLNDQQNDSCIENSVVIFKP